LFIFIVIASVAAAAVFFYPKNRPPANPPVVSPTSVPTQAAETIPLPSGENIIRTFFELINKRRFPEVLAMMDSQMIPNDTTKQEWTVSLNGIASIKLTQIEKHQPEFWTAESQIYQVTLQVKNQPGVTSFVPDNGENTRWVRLQKSANLWKIAEIATGP